MDAPLQSKLDALKVLLRGMESMVVAYSGGVDSTLLLRVVTDTPSVRHLAITTDSPTNTREEIEQAAALARSFGAHHLVVGVNELDTPGYADNPAHRCYLCKQTLYPLCLRWAERERLAYVVDGVNVDDLDDYRPGLQAASELGVRHPLVEVGLDKAEIRRLSASYGLETADKPASPCLSSRFPYGVRIDAGRLAQVEAAERQMRELGFVELRVRHLGGACRVEVTAGELERLASPALRARIRSALRKEGFSNVEISREPLRSGSLNDALRPRAQAAAWPAPGPQIP